MPYPLVGRRPPIAFPSIGGSFAHWVTFKLYGLEATNQLHKKRKAAYNLATSRFSIVVSVLRQLMRIQLERFAKLVHCIITRGIECNPFSKVLGRRCNQIVITRSR